LLRSRNICSNKEGYTIYTGALAAARKSGFPEEKEGFRLPVLNVRPSLLKKVRGCFDILTVILYLVYISGYIMKQPH